MEFINATTLHRKSGGAKWRDLLYLVSGPNRIVIPTGAKRSGGI
jgi:hypothetical protein